MASITSKYREAYDEVRRAFSRAKEDYNQRFRSNFSNYPVQQYGVYTEDSLRLMSMELTRSIIETDPRISEGYLQMHYSNACRELGNFTRAAGVANTVTGCHSKDRFTFTITPS